ncbi:uncharacterized protein G2W53_026230 [Senna tora]|uniref:Uncharacterized protein n=1 Tax=Senna tora TaxID=362788 RepID=A0A834WEX0_9FABA|nr:uncharacterized protein G2W53_026230 [Senna tora]
MDHVLTYSGRQIAVGAQKSSRITRPKTCCASESNASVHIVFANRSGFDTPIGVVLAREERGSSLNIFPTTNHRDFRNLQKLRGKRLVAQKPSRITRQKTCCASESNASVHVVFANRSGFDDPIGVFLAREERGSSLNIFRTTNHGQISETFTNYEAKDLLRKVVLLRQLESSWHGRSVDHVLTYSGRQIVVGSQKPSRITMQKTCCASESNTSVRVVFANRSGFDAPIGVILAREERGSCPNIFRTTNHVVLAREERGSRLNIFRTTNRDRISETFTNNEAKDLLCKSMDQVLTYSGRKITVGSQKPSRITRQKTCCAIESNTSVRVVFANRSGFDSPTGVVLAREERGSFPNIFRTTNHVGSQKPSRITRQKTCCARESNTSVRVVFANQSGFDAPIGVVLAREERGSCLNIFRTTNHAGSQKPSRITRQKTCCASESNTSVRIVFANRSGFDAPTGVVLAREERGSFPNIFRTTNHGRIS